jgi:putative ABC transport system permease protein
MILPGIAGRNLRLRWPRSLLAVVGIVIGVAAISSMGVIGNSLVLSVSDSLTSAGDTIVITPHVSAPAGIIAGVSPGGLITVRQVEEIRRASGANQVIPIRTGAEQITVGNEVKTVPLYAMDPADVPVLLGLDSGSYLRSGSVAMAGWRLADENALEAGESIGIGTGEERVRIAGILKERGVGLDLSPDEALVVPDTWFTPRYGERDYDEVIIRVRNPRDIDGIKAAVNDRLNRQEQVVNILDTRKLLTTIVDTFNQFAVLVTVIGAISLAASGICLCAVMLMSVAERKREIGILRALGARRGQVLRIFLSEALLLGLLGSAAGGILSLAGGYLAVRAMTGTTGYLLGAGTLVYLLTGMAFGILVSLLAGIYPAWKAAMMGPGDALRFE